MTSAKAEQNRGTQTRTFAPYGIRTRDDSVRALQDCASWCAWTLETSKGFRGWCKILHILPHYSPKVVICILESCNMESGFHYLNCFKQDRSTVMNTVN